MISFVRLRSGLVQRADGTIVPSDPDNQDFAAYLAADPSCVADEPPPTLTEADCQAAIQQRLDAVAVAWGYDDLKSAASYAGDDEDPVFSAEGVALRRWRSRTWRVGTDILNAQTALIAAGNQPTITSLADLLALLPAPPARP